MKASEIIEQYQRGERDFQGVNLFRQSFQGQNLRGANFSDADLRGANFAFSQLSGARFHGAKIGFCSFWIVLVLMLSSLIVSLVGIYCFLLAVFICIMFSGIDAVTYIGAITAAVISFIVYFSLKKSTVCLPQFWLISGSIIGVVTGAILGAVDYRLAVTLSALGIFGGVTAGLVIVVIALTVAVTITFSHIAVGMVVAVAIPLIATLAATRAWIAIAPSFGVALVLTFCGCCLAWLVRNSDRRLNWLSWFVSATTAVGGTSFLNADLTDAEFTDVNVRGVDWRGTKIDCIK